MYDGSVVKPLFRICEPGILPRSFGQISQYNDGSWPGTIVFAFRSLRFVATILRATGGTLSSCPCPDSTVNLVGMWTGVIYRDGCLGRIVNAVSYLNASTQAFRGA